MKVIISDANILINLAETDLLIAFTELDIHLHTNDFIIDEVEKPKRHPERMAVSVRNQIEKINDAIKDNKLLVGEIKNDEYDEIFMLKVDDLSFQDCSIWYYTKKLGGILLTGDNNLRKNAKASGIEVRGILYVLDILVENKLISHKTAHEKLEYLSKKTDARLPQKEVNVRLKKWTKVE